MPPTFLYLSRCPHFHPRLTRASGSWKWTDGSTFGRETLRETDHFTASGVQPWMKGNGHGHNGAQQCGRWGWKGLRVWADVPCDQKRPASCRVPPPPPPMEFTFLDQKLTFDEAERECMKLGGHLASIHSEAEFHRVFDNVAKHKGTDTDSWLGLTTGMPPFLFTRKKVSMRPAVETPRYISARNSCSWFSHH